MTHDSQHLGMDGPQRPRYDLPFILSNKVAERGSGTCQGGHLSSPNQPTNYPYLSRKVRITKRMWAARARFREKIDRKNPDSGAEEGRNIAV